MATHLLDLLDLSPRPIGKQCLPSCLTFKNIRATNYQQPGKLRNRPQTTRFTSRKKTEKKREFIVLQYRARLA
jgi:hypothetical protein